MPFDPSQPFDVVEEKSGFDPSKPFDVVDSPEPVSGFDPSKPYEVVQDKPKSSPSWFKTEQLKEDFSPERMRELGEAMTYSPLRHLPRAGDALLKRIPESADPLTKLQMKINAGGLDVAQDMAEFSTSPLGIMTAGIGGLGGPLIRRGLAAIFAPTLIKPAAQKLGEASVTKDPRTATEGVLLAATAGVAGKHAAMGEPMARLKPSEVKASDVQVDAEKAAREKFGMDETPADAFDEVLADPSETRTINSNDSSVPPAEQKIEPAKVEPVAEVPKPISVGPGAESVGEIAPSNLAQLTSAITRLADEAPETSPARAFNFGDTLSGVKDSASSALDGLRAAGQYIAQKFEGRPVWTQMKEAVGDRHLALSESVHNARKFTERALKEVPDKELQEAISNWVDTGGDEARLGAAAVESKGKYKAGYERALRLTPEQKLFAENLKNYFESRLDEAQKAGIMEDGIENYIHRIYESDSGFKRGVLAELGSGLSTATPGLAKQRVFEYDFEAEQAGLKPIKSFVKRVAAYDLALNKAIADRAAVKAMMEIKMPDGRPAIDVAGLGMKTIPDAEGASATLINPKWKPTDVQTPAKFRGDYRAIDAPALRKWKWVSADEAGNPTFVQGDVLVHPDAFKQVNAMVGRSAIRNNPIGRAALNVGSTIKQTMLDLSLFHPVQIAVHGFEHRSFFPAKEIDFTNPEVRGLIKGGMVVGETSGRQMFDEGLAGSSLTKHIPGIGPKVVALKDWIFQSYIPRLKVSTGLHALERNRARFQNLSEAEVNHLTANQMNRAFGELNYEMMARNKTAQDVFRLTALAPDFLEARAGFVAQAFTKYGREQTTALLYGAAAMYILARVMNKLIDGQYHMDLKDAFSVVHKGKAYGLRTVQGDVIHAGTDFMHFLRNRLNPAITRPVLEAVTGRDEFGRKRTAGQQALDYVATAIPISLNGAFHGREKTLLESLLNSTGLTMRRATATANIQTKMGEWMTKNKIQRGPGEFIYDPDKDQYRAIRLAAQEGDVAATKAEIEKAIKAGVSRAKIIKHFSDATRRPVTGSRANDLKFYNSLSDDDKKTFNEAKKEKAAVFSVIRQAR